MVMLTVLPVLAMFWNWRDARRVPFGVLGGGLFRAPWHIAHAGFCMDQPTIGKWCFWSTVFSGAWILFTLLTYRICRPCSRAVRKTYAILTLSALFIYLLVHTVPFFWTIQYIHAMGFTPHRLIALTWGITGYAVLITLTAMFVRQSVKKKPTVDDGLKAVSVSVEQHCGGRMGHGH